AGRSEAELLRIGLRRDRQPEPLRDRPRARLDEPTDGEERARQLPLSQHVEHVALILRAVRAAPELPRAPVVADRADVMPGRHQVDPQFVRPPEERPELDLAVAADTWVRGAPRTELADEVRDHRPLELVAEVADLEREP